MVTTIALAVGVVRTGWAQDSPSDGIQELLDRRGEAVRTRDQASFLAGLDTQATTFVQSQQSWFQRIGVLPLGEYSLRANLDEDPDLTRAQDRKKYGAETVVAAVEERMKIDGFDRVPLLNRQFLTFVRRDQEWGIASDSDLDDLGLNTSRHLWDFGAVQIQRSTHFMLLLHESEADLASTLLPLAEQALSDVDRIWKRDWNHQVVVYLPASNAELEKILDLTVDVGNFVAFATNSIDRREAWAPTAPRIVLNLNNFRRYTPQGQRSIFSHELLHVATRDASGPFVNLMIEEGLAQLAEPGGAPDLARVRQRARDASGLTLPEDPEFVSGTGSEIIFAYQRAFSVFDFLSRRFGLEEVSEFYASLGMARIEPGTSEYHLDRNLKAVFGLTRHELETEWIADLRSG